MHVLPHLPQYEVFAAEMAMGSEGYPVYVSNKFKSWIDKEFQYAVTVEMLGRFFGSFYMSFNSLTFKVAVGNKDYNLVMSINDPV